MKLIHLRPNFSRLDFVSGSVYYSYQTIVAVKIEGIGTMRTSTKYSVTTSRHMNKELPSQAREIPQQLIESMAAQIAAGNMVALDKLYTASIQHELDKAA